MKLSPSGIKLLQQLEGVKLRAYKDQGGVWTIGYGHTGKEVQQGLIWTMQYAKDQLIKDLESRENAVTKLIKVKVNQNQFDAIMIFVFNVGLGAFKDSTLLKLLNNSDFVGASKQFDRWNRVNGVVNIGLVNRRNYEQRLFDRV